MSRITDVLIAHDERTGRWYLREFGMDPATTRVVTRASALRGYGVPMRFLYVNSDNATPDPAVVEALRVIEGCGAEVDWFGFA